MIRLDRVPHAKEQPEQTSQSVSFMSAAGPAPADSERRMRQISKSSWRCCAGWRPWSARPGARALDLGGGDALAVQARFDRDLKPDRSRRGLRHQGQLVEKLATEEIRSFDAIAQPVAACISTRTVFDIVARTTPSGRRR